MLIAWSWSNAIRRIFPKSGGENPPVPSGRLVSTARPKYSGVVNRNRANANFSPHQSSPPLRRVSRGCLPSRRKLTCPSSSGDIIVVYTLCESSLSAMLFRCHLSSPIPGAALYIGAARAYATASQSLSRGSNPAREALTACFNAVGNDPFHVWGHHITSPPSNSPHRFRSPHAKSPGGTCGPRAKSPVHPWKLGEKHPPLSKGSMNLESSGSWPPRPMESGPLVALGIAEPAEVTES